MDYLLHAFQMLEYSRQASRCRQVGRTGSTEIDVGDPGYSWALEPFFTFMIQGPVPKVMVIVLAWSQIVSLRVVQFHKYLY